MRRPGRRPERASLVPLLVLGVAMVVAAALLAYWGRGQWFGSDDVGYAVRLATQPLGHALLHPPPNKYLIAVPLLLYDALFRTFGFDTYVPYRIVGIFFVLLCAGLLFALLRRRIPDRFAVPPALLMLFFGAGAGVVVSPARIPSQFALAAGLGMLLALERRTRRGDLAAMGLLAVSLASHPLGISFAAAAVAMIVLRSRDGWRGLWVVLPPGVLFAIWWLFIRPPDLPSFVPNRATDVFPFMRQSWAALTAAVSGLFGVVQQPALHQPPAWVAAIALLALIAVGIAFSWRRLPPTFWAALLGLAVLMATTRLSPAGWLRVPDEPRYLYPEAFFLLIALGTLAGSLRLPEWAMWVASGVLLLSLWPNIDRLHDASRGYRVDGARYRVQWSAAEIGEPSTRAGFTPGRFSPTAREYLAAVHEFGSGSYSPAEVARLPDEQRQLADTTLVDALGLRLVPSRGPSGSSCLASSGELELPAQGVRLGSGEGRATLLLGRFADRPTVQLSPPAGAAHAELRFPPDGAERPWRLLVRSPRPIAVCGLGSRAPRRSEEPRG